MTTTKDSATSGKSQPTNKKGKVAAAHFGDHLDYGGVQVWSKVH